MVNFELCNFPWLQISRFPGVQLNSLLTYRRALLSERLEQATEYLINTSYMLIWLVSDMMSFLPWMDTTVSLINLTKSFTKNFFKRLICAYSLQGSKGLFEV